MHLLGEPITTCFSRNLANALSARIDIGHAMSTNLFLIGACSVGANSIDGPHLLRYELPRASQPFERTHLRHDPRLLRVRGALFVPAVLLNLPGRA
jgi:hypothetical protein